MCYRDPSTAHDRLSGAHASLRMTILNIKARFIMKMMLAAVFCAFTFLLMLVPPTHAAAEPQVFPTSTGPVKITPLNHASTLIEAGGKTIYLDPAKPAKLTGLPKADLILITDIHGDHMDPDSIKNASKADTEIFAAPAVVQTVTSAKPIANGETKTWQAWTSGKPSASRSNKCAMLLLRAWRWSSARAAAMRPRNAIAIPITSRTRLSCGVAFWSNENFNRPPVISKKPVNAAS